MIQIKKGKPGELNDESILELPERQRLLSVREATDFLFLFFFFFFFFSIRNNTVTRSLVAPRLVYEEPPCELSCAPVSRFRVQMHASLPVIVASEG